MNELKISDFRNVLLKQGMKAEFDSGVLVCNGLIAVKKVSVCNYSFLQCNKIKFIENFNVLCCENTDKLLKCFFKIFLIWG